MNFKDGPNYVQGTAENTVICSTACLNLYCLLLKLSKPNETKGDVSKSGVNTPYFKMLKLKCFSHRAPNGQNFVNKFINAIAVIEFIYFGKNSVDVTYFIAKLS